MKFGCTLGLFLLSLPLTPAFATPATAPAKAPDKAHTQPTASVTAEQALQKLRDGNANYVSYHQHGAHVDAKLRAELAKGQHPFAIVVTCSDSRVGPEIVFDQTLGDLFVVRCAGGLVDQYDLGSIEYAVEHLGTPLIVVMGHERCGAVKAATGNDKLEGSLATLVNAIKPAVAAAQKAGDKSLDGAVKENTRRVAAKVRADLKTLHAPFNTVKVVGAHIDLDTGKVDWLK